MYKLKSGREILLEIWKRFVKIQCWVTNHLLSWKFSLHQRVAIPPEVPLALTALPEFNFHFDLLKRRRGSSSILVSWSRRMSEETIFNKSLMASALVGFPRPLQFQDVICIIYPIGRECLVPLGALISYPNHTTFLWWPGCLAS